MSPSARGIMSDPQETADRRAAMVRALVSAGVGLRAAAEEAEHATARPRQTVVDLDSREPLP